MAVLAHIFEPPVIFVDQYKYLEDLYVSNVGYAPKNIFDVITPFRMDLEAEKLADIMLHVEKGTNFKSPRQLKRDRRKEKRRQDTRNMYKDKFNEFKETSEYLSRSLKLLKDVHPGLFSPLPTADLVRKNNYTVRQLSKDIAYGTCDPKCPLQSENAQSKASIVKTKEGMSFKFVILLAHFTIV